jgi:ABC-type uncharacterized transport system fused permease/ATPase subunit
VPKTSIVSVGHQPSVEVFHDHQIDLGKYSTARTHI